MGIGPASRADATRRSERWRIELGGRGATEADRLPRSCANGRQYSAMRNPAPRAVNIRTAELGLEAEPRGAVAHAVSHAMH
jgi:hypothetical protein